MGKRLFREKVKMKEYFVAWYFLDQGMEGIPNLTPAFIIEAKDEQEAIKKYPKEIKKNMKGYGRICVLGKIKDNELLLEREYFNIRLLIEDLYKTAKYGNYRIL